MMGGPGGGNMQGDANSQAGGPPSDNNMQRR